MLLLAAVPWQQVQAAAGQAAGPVTAPSHQTQATAGQAAGSSEVAQASQRSAAAELQSAGAVPSPAVQARWPGLALSGFVQADGVLYNQASEDQLNDATREPLNETR